MTNLCESFEELAEGQGDYIEGVIGKLNKSIDGTLGCRIALDHVQGETRVDGELRDGIWGGGGEERRGGRTLFFILLMRACTFFCCGVAEGAE